MARTMVLVEIDHYGDPIVPDDHGAEDRRAAIAMDGPPGGVDPFPSVEELVRDQHEYEPTEPPSITSMDPAALLDELARLEGRVGRAQARQVEVLDQLARRRECYAAPADARDPNVPDYWADQVADEVSARVCWTRWQANRRTDEARRLLECLPGTLAALTSGRVDYSRVRVVVRATELLTPADAAAVDAAVADRLPGLTTSQLREVLAAEVIAVDAEAAKRREEKATADRTVVVEPLPDSQSALHVIGPAAKVQGIAEHLDTLAGPDQGSGGEPLGARMFDALDAAVAAAVENGPDDQQDGDDRQEVPAPGDRRRRSARAQVLVAVNLTTLIGLDEQPAYLAGYGPIPAHVARQIATDGVLRRILTDPVTGIVVGVDGHVHPDGYQPPDDSEPPPPDDPGPPDDDPGPPGDPPDHPAPPSSVAGSSKADRPPEAAPCPIAKSGGGLYRPRLALARLIRLRDQTCTAMGCRRRAEKCDLDHLINHPDGPTCACNLHPLCRRHHNMKTHTAWQPVRLSDGSTLWTSPTAHSYVRPPRPLLDPPRVRPPRRFVREASRPVRTLTPGWPESGDRVDPGDAEPPF